MKPLGLNTSGSYGSVGLIVLATLNHHICAILKQNKTDDNLIRSEEILLKGLSPVWYHKQISLLS